MSGIVKFSPSVLSKANPQGGLLLRVRASVQQNEALREVVSTVKGADEMASRLEAALLPLFPNDDLNEIAAAARYLADEHSQIGSGILLINRHTGKAIAKLSEEDLYKPAPVPREDGRMVERPLTIRPDIEAFMVQWHFDRDREQGIQKEALQRIPQTDLVRHEGDRRALIYTTGGRKILLEMIQQSLAGLFDENPFKGALEVTVGASSKTLHFKAFARVSIPMVDLKHRNTHQDVLKSAQSGIRSQWSREIGRVVSLEVRSNVPETETTFQLMEDIVLWVAGPTTAWRLKSTGNACLAVEGAKTTGFGKGSGFVYIDPTSFEVQARELFDRWEVVAAMQFSLDVDWSLVRAFDFTDVLESFEAEPL
jgi:hypothetical protein